MSDDPLLRRTRALLMLTTTESEEGLREIADILRSGEVEPNFLRHLGNLMDPDKEPMMGGLKLVLKRSGGGTPKAWRSEVQADLEHFLEIHIVFFKEKHEAVMAEARRRFGVGKTKCDNALKRVKAMHARDPEIAEMHRETAIHLRDHGHEDYQPL